MTSVYLRISKYDTFAYYSCQHSAGIYRYWSLSRLAGRCCKRNRLSQIMFTKDELVV